MSDLFLSVLISVAILAAMFIFVPMLDVCGPHCQRLFLRMKRTEQPVAEPEGFRKAA